MTNVLKVVKIYKKKIMYIYDFLCYCAVYKKIKLNPVDRVKGSIHKYEDERRPDCEEAQGGRGCVL